MSHTREQLVFLAKLAEQSERYEEMVTGMKEVARMGDELSVEERNLLSIGYKKVVSNLRASWRIISSIEQKEETRGNAENVKLISEYRRKVEGELENICQDILQVLEENLIPSASSSEPKVFYLKMKGDYLRYLAEFTVSKRRMEVADSADKAYMAAAEVANSQLSPTHPIRLGLALNYSVFFYEILNSPEKACNLAKTAFDEALREIDSVTEDTYNDSTLIMQLLRDNLSLWTADISEAAADIVQCFKNIVAGTVDISTPVASIKALTQYIQENRANTMIEFTRDLEAATKTLLAATHNCVSIKAGCELFTRFVTRSGADTNEDFEAFKKSLVERGNTFVDRAYRCRDRIADLALEFIQDNSTILVHSLSRVVTILLLRAAAANRRFRVFVTESKPTSQGFEAVKILQQHGIIASVILDSAVGYYINLSDMVLVGAEGVVENGGVVNQIGTYTVAVMAKAANIPFYAVAESHKFVRFFPLNQLDLPSYFSGNLLFTECQDNCDELLEPNHPSVDYTPPAYITLLFTDLGVLTPSGVSDELIKLYY